MSEWKEVRFEEAFEVPLRNGLTKPSKLRGTGLKMVNMKEIFAYDKISDETDMELVPVEEKEKISLLQYNDLLFARQSLVESGAGKVAIFKGRNETVFESHLIRCRINQNIFSPDFVYYYWKSPIGKGHISTIVNQTAAAGIKGSDLQTLPIPLPPLPEQKSIASIFSSLDAKIDLLHRQNATLEKITEALFRQWFVKDVNHDWEEVKMESLISIGSGKGLKRDYFVENGLYPVLGANGEIGRTNQFLFDEKLIYTGRVGTLGNIFRVENEKVWLSDNTLIIRPLKYFNFVYFLLKNSHLEEYDVGSTQPLIRQQDVKEIEFKMPTEQQLDKFELFAEDIFDKIKSNQNQVQTLTTLRDTLLPKLMSGEVRVEM